MKPQALTRKSGPGKQSRGREKKAQAKSNTHDGPAQLTAPMQEAFLNFIEYHPPARVSRHLRRMLVEWLMSDGAREAMDFGDIMHDIDGVFGLLDRVGGEAGLKAG